MEQRRETIIVLGRYPVPGRAKTRLIPACGSAGAAEVHRALAGRTVLVARVAGFLRGASVEVHGTDGSAGAFRAWLGPVAYRRQTPGDLGVRMAAAMAAPTVGEGARAVLVGSDCPYILPRHIDAAFARLRDQDVVLGPALDGGYYLLGLRRPVPELFRGIPWSTEHVLGATRAIIARRGLSVAFLEPLADVDRPRDLDAWRCVAGQAVIEAAMSRGEAPFPPPAGVMPGSISVVIPALNEAALVGGAVETALRYEGAEVIVVDARSTDGTAAEAAAHGAHVLACPASRAAQQNLGALHARGEVLLFLHADARLPAGYAAQVRETLARSRVSAGAFRLRIAGRGAALRLVEAATHVRARLLRMPYGDQAIFLPRDTFVAAGGFATMPLMEDYELVRRLGRLGRVAVARAATTVSGRRWARLGVWRTTWVNRLVILGYRLGVPAATLARFYWGRA